MSISRRRFTAASLAAGAGALLGGNRAGAQGAATQGAALAGQRDGILVPEHFVPTPKTISVEAQAMLRAKFPNTGGQFPAPGDVAGWKAFRSAADGGLIAMGKGHAVRYPAEVVTHRLSASQLYEITPKNLADENAGRALVYVHGGAFIIGGGEAAIYPAMQLAGIARCKVYSVDYRLAPEFPFPIPVEDALEAYRFVLRRHDPAAVALFGGSAGANLVAALTLKARDTGVPMPAACALHSCPSDLGDWGDSGYTNDTVDIVLQHATPGLRQTYSGGHDVKDPYLSPVFGDFSKGFPPTILTSGTRDMLLSNTVRLHRALLRAGAKAELHVWEAMTHAPFIGAPEEQEFYDQHVGFMLAHTKAG